MTRRCEQCGHQYGGQEHRGARFCSVACAVACRIQDNERRRRESGPPSPAAVLAECLAAYAALLVHPEVTKPFLGHQDRAVPE